MGSVDKALKAGRQKYAKRCKEDLLEVQPEWNFTVKLSRPVEELDDRSHAAKFRARLDGPPLVHGCQPLYSRG